MLYSGSPVLIKLSLDYWYAYKYTSIFPYTVMNYASIKGIM